VQVSLEHFGRDQQPASMASLFKTSSTLLSEMILAAAQHQKGAVPAGHPRWVDMKRSDPAHSVPRQPQLPPAPSPRA